MAHAAKLGGLTEELVTIITSFTPKNDPSKFNRLKDSSVRSLRHHNHIRTNKFDVTSQLEGLVEKFSVHDKDPLAEALKERLQLLSSLGVRWESEILHFLLELSDRPVANSRLEDLDHLKEPEPDAGPPLRWKDLVAEVPLLREKHIWRNVDFAADSSEDEFEDSHSDLSDPTTVESSIDEGLYTQPSHFAAEAVGEEGLKALRKAQYWLKAPSIGGIKLETVKKPITDLQAVREVLFMLAGLPTSIFQLPPGKQMIVQPSTGYTIKSTSYDSYHEIMKDLAELGTTLHTLRSWSRGHQSIPLLQVFQGAISLRLMDFDRSISKLQQRFVALEDDMVVSLLSIKTQVSMLARPLLHLSAVIQSLEAEPYAHSFRYLELLYEETCTYQLAGDEQLYAFVGSIFFDCFQLYLSPLRKWMEEGDLDPKDKVFFISQSPGKTELISIWQSRYKLRQSQNGVLHAPGFIRAAANKIFTTGKSVVVLKQLNRFHPLKVASKSTEPVLSFEQVCRPDRYLAPFPELFNAALEDWINSKHHHASDNLRNMLFNHCGLHTALDALLSTYFMADGASSCAFTKHVFDKLDTLDESWKDRFTLTELAQSIFGITNPVASDCLMVKTSPLPRRLQPVVSCRRTVKTLSIIELKYQLSWPIQLIIKPDIIPLYQRIFTFLFQVRRSSQILSRQRLIKDPLTYTSSSSERALYYSLRTRLLWFNQTLYHYLTAIVLDCLSSKIRSDLHAAEDIDTMIAVHSAFLKLATDQALLGSKLELIQKTILNILDLGIKLEDAQAANALASKEAIEHQQTMMDLSMGSLGLHTPKRKTQTSRFAHKASASKRRPVDSSSEDEEAEGVVDMSIMSSPHDGNGELSFVEQLRKMKADFDRLVRFVASGLKGVARAGGGEEAKSWDLLGEMLEAGIGSDVKY